MPFNSLALLLFTFLFHSARGLRDRQRNTLQASGKACADEAAKMLCKGTKDNLGPVNDYFECCKTCDDPSAKQACPDTEIAPGAPCRPDQFLLTDHGIVLNCNGHDGEAYIDLKANEINDIVTLPKGIKNFKVSIESTGDLDLRLRKATSNQASRDCLIGFGCYLDRAGDKSKYGMHLKFSGDQISPQTICSREELQAAGTRCVKESAEIDLASENVVLAVRAYAHSYGRTTSTYKSTVRYWYEGIENCPPSVRTSCKSCISWTKCPTGSPQCDGTEEVKCGAESVEQTKYGVENYNECCMSCAQTEAITLCHGSMVTPAPEDIHSYNQCCMQCTDDQAMAHCRLKDKAMRQGAADSINN